MGARSENPTGNESAFVQQIGAARGIVMSQLAPTTASTLVPLNPKVEQSIYDTLRTTEEREAQTQSRIAYLLTRCAPLIMVSLIVISSYQGAVILSEMAGEGTKTPVNQFITIVTALCLIVGANVIGVRLLFASGWLKLAGQGICFLLFCWSAATSMLYLAAIIQSSADISSKSEMRIEAAQERARIANQIAFQLTYQQSVEAYNDAVGRSSRDISDRVEAAQQAALDAQDELDRRINRGETMAKLLGYVAAFFGVTVTALSWIFAAATVLLMELLRWYQSYQTGASLYRSVENRRAYNVFDVEPIPQPTPRTYTPKATQPTANASAFEAPLILYPSRGVQPKTATQTEETSERKQGNEEETKEESLPMRAKPTDSRVSFQRKVARVVNAIRHKAFEPTVANVRDLVGGGTNSVQRVRRELVRLGVCDRGTKGELIVKGAR